MLVRAGVPALLVAARQQLYSSQRSSVREALVRAGVPAAGAPPSPHGARRAPAPCPARLAAYAPNSAPARDLRALRLAEEQRYLLYSSQCCSSFDRLAQHFAAHGVPERLDGAAVRERLSVLLAAEPGTARPLKQGAPGTVLMKERGAAAAGAGACRCRQTTTHRPVILVVIIIIVLLFLKCILFSLLFMM